MCVVSFFFFKQKTAYEVRISDWSSDVCSSDLRPHHAGLVVDPHLLGAGGGLRQEALFGAAGEQGALVVDDRDHGRLQAWDRCRNEVLDRGHLLVVEAGAGHGENEGGDRLLPPRREERRGGKEGGSTCEYRGW